jgi:hypothetical protein
VLVVCDHFSKYVEIFPLKTQTAEDVADCLLQFVCRHSMPETILSDQGTNFQSEMLADLYDLLDIHKVRTTPYHAQCDGMSERFNRTLQAMLKHYANEEANNWDLHIPLLQFAYNTEVHYSTKATPFEIIYGRKPTIPADVVFGHLEMDLLLQPESYAAEIQDGFKVAYEVVAANRDVRMDNNKLNSDRKVRGCKFEKDDLVWLLHDTLKGVKRKFSKKWTGIYQITETIGDVNYRIKLMNKPKSRSKIVHQMRLKRAFMIEKQEKQTGINTILVKSKQSEKTKRMNQKDIQIEENLPDLFNETNEIIQTSIENKLIEQTRSTNHTESDARSNSSSKRIDKSMPTIFKGSDSSWSSNSSDSSHQEQNKKQTLDITQPKQSTKQSSEKIPKKSKVILNTQQNPRRSTRERKPVVPFQP